MKHVQIPEGTIFGKWTVLEGPLRDRSPKNKFYLCKCDCGNERIVLGPNLKSGKSLQCKACYFNVLSPGMIGVKFYSLTALWASHSNKNNIFYEFQCECGSYRICNGSDVRLGKIKSCTSCKHTLHESHGMKGSSIYNIWMGIKARCLNPKNRAYKNYGGRGITLDERWHSFEEFYKDMGDRPDTLQIDRINNDGPYTKENCHWVTSKENCNNRRKKVKDECNS